jgi:hypothetical protein
MLFIPIAVGLLTVIATVWYGFVWVPRQETYYQERYLRQLAIMENQIKGKIEGFDNIMDHLAAGKEHAFFESHKDIGMEYLDANEVDDKDFKNAVHDPPSVKLKADEGTYCLFLAFRYRPESHGNKAHSDGREIFAKAKIDQLINPFLSETDNVDAILVAQANGQVVFQRSGSTFATSGSSAYRPKTRFL